MVIKNQIIKIKNKKFKIRVLKKDDKDNLIKYFHNLSTESKRWYHPHDFDNLTIKNICNNLNNTEVKRIVISYKKEIVGYCVIKLGWNEWDNFRAESCFKNNEVLTIAPSVSDNYQKIGLGTKMMEYIYNIAVKYFKKVIVLWGGVVIKNSKAVSFYKKNNFKIIREWYHPLKKVINYDMYLYINNKECKKKVLIIGAAGSLGQEFCKLFFNEGYDLVGIDIKENELTCFFRNYNFPIYIEDLYNSEKIIKIIEYEKIDTIINCVSFKNFKWNNNDIKRCIEINVLSILEIMKYLFKNNKDFIFVRSDTFMKYADICILIEQFIYCIIKFFNFKVIRGVNVLDSKTNILEIWNHQKNNNKSFTLIEDCNKYFMTTSQMSFLVKNVVDARSDKIKYKPIQIYKISIQNLFKAYLKINNISEYDTTIISNEKMNEYLDYTPQIIELVDIEDICNLLKDVME